MEFDLTKNSSSTQPTQENCQHILGTESTLDVTENSEQHVLVVTFPNWRVWTCRITGQHCLLETWSDYKVRGGWKARRISNVVPVPMTARRKFVITVLEPES